MNKPLAIVMVCSFVACGGKSEPATPTSAPEAPAATAPAEKPLPPLDPNNIVSIALNSPDHTTLIAAVKAADYVAVVSNAGPLTVFAPTNAAFDKLPAGTVETLLKPENVDQLRNIIKYHATTSVYTADNIKDGQVMWMANGGKVTFHLKDGKFSVNDANVVASVRASNGIVHVIDSVLLPK